MTSVLPGIGSRKKKGSLQSSSIKLPQATHKHRQSRIAASTVHPTNRVVVAVNAAKLTRHALEWALNNVVQPGDHITLLALWPSGRKLWNLPFFSGDCARSWKKGTKPHELQQEINDSCCSMMDELHALCDSKKARVTVKVVPDGRPGAIAVEVQQAGPSWVVLDKQVMKREGKLCMEQLRCNLVLVKQNNSKILRLNLKGSPPHEAGYVYSDSNLQFGDEYDDHTARHQAPRKRTSKSKCKGTHHASSDADSLASSPDVGTPFTASETGTSSPRSLATSPPTSGEPPVLLHSSLITCADSTIPGDAAVWDADYISDIEADSVSDYGAVDFLSAITADRSGPLCTPASGSPDESGAEGIFDKSFRMMPEAWVEPEFLEGSLFREAWKPAPMSSMSSRSPTSANATPKSENMSYTRSSAKQGRVSSASPSPSNRAVGSGPSVSSRAVLEGGARVRAHSTSPQSRTGRSAISSKLPPSCRQRDLLKSWRPPSDTDSKPTSGAASSRSVVTTRELLEKFLEWDQSKRSSDKLRDYDQLGDGDFERTSSVRRAMSLAKHHVPAGPPPLCSICQHKSPVFGKPPKRFSYAELELATGGFPKANFLAEGGFGSVHRGVLPDGQAVAVKQHKHPSSQGDIEFCSEVEVLSCAQHRNVVMLIGYCIEDNERLLVYEFICNGSLDSHLYGSEKDVLTWAARQKIAVGAARGLRYLHEECRVGCIIHRDMRPNNILLTHDFEPMVGDFGLARWQPDGDLGVQTRVIGTFGYLAPEYAQSGQITEKADVYSFGVVLLELATGRKAVELTRAKGQQCLTEWARPLLEQGLLHDLTDPRLEGQYAEYELHCLLHAASLCISKDPQLRPRMSQVLRILEGDIVIDGTISSSPPPYNASKLAPFDNRLYNGSRSTRISAEYNVRAARAGSVSPPLVSYSGSLLLTSSGSQGGSSSRNLLSTSDYPAAATKLSYEALRAAYLPDANPNCSPRRLSFEEL